MIGDAFTVLQTDRHLKPTFYCMNKNIVYKVTLGYWVRKCDQNFPTKSHYFLNLQNILKIDTYKILLGTRKLDVLVQAVTQKLANYRIVVNSSHFYTNSINYKQQ